MQAQIAVQAQDRGALKFAYKTSERRQQFKQIRSVFVRWSTCTSEWVYFMCIYLSLCLSNVCVSLSILRM